jgi:hypothetical protein
MRITAKTLTAAVLTALLATGSAMAANNDHGGFGENLFANQVPGALLDPDSADAAAVLSVEPAAGDLTPAKPARPAKVKKDGKKDQDATVEDDSVPAYDAPTVTGAGEKRE